ncbi:MAG: hypothetical protein BAJATHORv1_170008 [Candidatus Thorarchaeota archaeon]|nr:MAG: hypothetical protein BAJATHORv1_170008 [Candidatus Thorarchaeota archaeon]
MREEVEELEDHTDLGPDLVDVGLLVVDGDPIDDDPALIGRLQVVDAPQEGALATATGSEDEADLSPLNLEVDVHNCLGVPEALAEMFDENDVVPHRDQLGFFLSTLQRTSSSPITSHRQKG